MTIQENKNCEQRIQESMDYTELHIKAMFWYGRNNNTKDKDDDILDSSEVTY